MDLTLKLGKPASIVGGGTAGGGGKVSFCLFGLYVIYVKNV